MHFLRTLLLVAIATITGCGGGGSDNPWTAAPTEKGAGSATSPSDAFTLSSSSVTFTGTQGGADPAHQYVWIYRQSPASFDYVTISQRGTMFDQTYDFNTWYSPPVEVIDIRPGAPVEAGVFRGSIILNACYSAGGPPCNQAFGTPKTIQVTYNVAGLSVTPRQLTFSSTGSNPAMQTATLAVTGVASTYATQISYSPSATDWLQVKPRSGTPNLALGQQTLTFNVNAAGLPAGVHGAAVTFTSPPSFSVSMTVTLFVCDPRVNFVAPYVVSAGAGGN